MDQPPDIETILVPVDGSDESTTAVEYAVSIAAEYGAKLHTIHVLGEPANRAIDRGAVDPDDVAAETEAYTDVLVNIAEEAGVSATHSVAYGFSTSRKLVHPGNVILDAAEQMEADFIVIPRERSRDTGDVLEKAAEYVLLYASQPVLSV